MSLHIANIMIIYHCFMCMGGNFTKDLGASSHKAETGTSTLTRKERCVSQQEENMIERKTC